MTRSHATDARPHFIPGVYSWLTENFSKVYFTIITDHPNFVCKANFQSRELVLPITGITDSENKGCVFNTVTLNLGAEAINSFSMDSEGIIVNMRFNSIPTEVYIPLDAVIAIHAPEALNIQPFMFALMPGQEKYSKGAIKKVSLTVVNKDEAAAAVAIVESTEPRRLNHLSLVK